MKASLLIEENNRKRDLLTPENEKYYSDMMLYIRLQLTLSEQKSEEILMELLDHLLDGQNEGKTARDIFGNNPKAYADEIIKHLPNEDKRQISTFVLSTIMDLLSWVLMINGLGILIISQFKEIESEIYPVNIAILVGVILCIILFGIWYIFRLIKNSLFLEKSSDKKDMVKAGLFGAIGFMLILVVVKFIPNIGPAVHFPWWLSFSLGAIIWFVRFIYKKRVGGRE